jgi:hypothetical protein
LGVTSIEISRLGVPPAIAVKISGAFGFSKD